MSGVLCSRHQAELYEDVREGLPMARYLCPVSGCTAILAADQLGMMRDQAWCSANGMTAPGWQTLGEGSP